MDKEKFEMIHGHLKDGYENAQSIIKFTDTKSSVLITICLASIGFSVRVLLTHVPSSTVALVLFFTCLVGCVICSLLSITARPPSSNSGLTVLFPFISSQKLNIRGCQSYFCKTSDRQEGYELNKLKAINKDVILEEYQNQLTQVGIINGKKSFWHRRATKLLLWALLLFLYLLAKELLK